MKRALILFVFLAGAVPAVVAEAERRAIVLDADTANEVDDLYAIVRAFAEPSWDIVALNATQWQPSQWTVPDSMEESHRLNTALHAYLELGDTTRLRRGGHRRMYDWGDKAVHSAAAYEIVRLAREQKQGERLTVVALGALTNIASALFIAPEIESKIELYWLGSTYDFETDEARFLDFNAMMDPQAAGLLHDSEVEMHVMPVNILGSYRFEFRRTKNELSGRHELGDYLVDRWFSHDGAGRQSRILWDVALIQAMLYPERATIQKATGWKNPKVMIYREIDTAFFIEEMYQSLKGKLSELSSD